MNVTQRKNLDQAWIKGVSSKLPRNVCGGNSPQLVGKERLHVKENLRKRRNEGRGKKKERLSKARKKEGGEHEGKLPNVLPQKEEEAPSAQVLDRN